MDKYVTRRVMVEALQLSPENLEEAAGLTGAFHGIDYLGGQKVPYLVLEVPNGKVRVLLGMWLVWKHPGVWLAMTDKNFRNKYELANNRGDRVPPYGPPPIPLPEPEPGKIQGFFPVEDI